MLHDITRYPNTQIWAIQVKDSLINLNFKNVWTNQTVLNYSSFIQYIKEMIKLLFMQEHTNF